MHAEIQPYLDYLRDHGRKDLTVDDYETKLDKCLDLLDSTDPQTITEADFLRLRTGLQGAEATVRAKLAALDRWVRWSTGRSVLSHLDLLWNRPQRHRAFIGTDDYRRLLDRAGPCDRIVLVLGGMLGLRRAEILAIRTEDVGQRSIRVHGKGHGVGMIADQPMAAEVRREIDRYLEWRADNGLDGYPYLLAIPDGHGGVCRRAHLDVVLSRRIKKLGDRCGVEVTVHTLRRFYATSIYRLTNHDIDLTRRLMRHADPATTLECYIQPDTAAMTDAVEMIAEVLI